MKPYKWLIAAAIVAILGATLALTGVLSKSHTGPAKAATINEVLGNTSVIKPLASVDAGCPWVDPHASQAGKQGDGITQKQFQAMPEQPSPTMLSCAIARAEAAGWSTADNGNAKCIIDKTFTVTDTTSGNDATVAGSTKKTVTAFCMNVGQKHDPSCVIAFAAVDRQGNFIANLDDPSAYMNVPRSYIAHRSAYAGC